MTKALKVTLVVLAMVLFLTGAARAATVTVTGNGDTIAVDGVVTLREAITSINAGANTNADVVAVGAYGASDTINFNITPAGFYLINVLSPLPTITKPVTINGATQGGSVQNSAATGDNSTHNIMLNCNSTGGNTCTDGLTLGAGSAGSTIRFLIFDSASGAGLVVRSANNTIAGNWIGLDSAGTGAAGANVTGISMLSVGPAESISNNTIGGPNPADRNIIGGNTLRQMFIARFDAGGFGGGSNITVENNYIGTNKNGTAGFAGSGQGILMTDLLNSTIGGASNSLGGPCAGLCNLISGNGQQGMQITGTSGPTSTGYLIQGNFFGTNVTGTAALSNGNFAPAALGITLNGSVTIGGTAAGTGNLISGQSNQGAGINIDSGNIGPINIQGNFIGTTTTGNAVLGNGGPGIYNHSSNVTIGGTTAAARNVIGGNGNGLTPKGPGILLEGNAVFAITATTVIQGNNIGIGADGVTNVGNFGDGIDVTSNSTGSTIGAATSGGAGGNIIAFNGAGRTNGAGIGVGTGNNAKILSNSIFSNTGTSTGLGIDLSATVAATDGPTSNDACDGDAGGNNLQNFPVLATAVSTGAQITIVGTLNSTASTAFTVEFFSNPSGAQGRKFLGSTNVNTNGACLGNINAIIAAVVSAGDNITATATDPSGNTSEFSAAVAATAATTAADSTISGTIVDRNGNPVEGVAIRLSGTQSRLTITDSIGNYRFDNVDTEGVYAVTPSRPNFIFGPTQRVFTGLGQHTDATFNATFTGANINPLDNTEYFVRQQYVDFLGREPDEAGFNFWVNNIQSCGADTKCIEVKRIDTSAAFFLSIEFQQTGYLVYRMYQAAYGDIAGTPVPVRFGDFKSDRQEIQNELIVLQPGWQTVLENNKQAFATDFVQRAQFTKAYPTTLSPIEFVDRLFINAGLTPSNADRLAAINEFAGVTTSADSLARARVLRRVADSPVLAQREFDQAFVLMEYFGYLRRDPNSGPDINFAGFDFWLTKLDGANGDFQKAEMVKAFLVATEYRQRFPR